MLKLAPLVPPSSRVGHVAVRVLVRVAAAVGVVAVVPGLDTELLVLAQRVLADELHRLDADDAESEDDGGELHVGEETEKRRDRVA